MGEVRNFIHILGITPSHELPNKMHGQIVLYSDIENLNIPLDRPNAKSVYEIIIELEITSSRKVSIPSNDILIIDGLRKFKIIYMSEDENKEAIIIDIIKPYNTFVELPKKIDDIQDIKVYILDSYFDLIDKREIYNYNLYLINVVYDDNQYSRTHSEDTYLIKDKKYKVLEDYKYILDSTDLTAEKKANEEQAEYDYYEKNP